MGSGAEVLQDNNYNSTSMDVYGSRTKNFPDDDFYVKNVWISTILIFFIKLLAFHYYYYYYYYYCINTFVFVILTIII